MPIYLVDKSDPPEKIEALVITAKTIKLRWKAPKDTGRSKIIAYNLKALPINGTKEMEKNAIVEMLPSVLLEYTFLGLQRNTYYQISVAAVNKAGQGRPLEATYKTALMDKGNITQRGCSGVYYPSEKRTKRFIAMMFLTDFYGLLFE